MPREFHCHKLVRKTAVEMAEALYEDVMRDNQAYEGWKKSCPALTPKWLRARFIAMMYPKLIEPARTTLAKMLGTNISEDLKRAIYDALLKDAALRPGRVQTASRSILQ